MTEDQGIVMVEAHRDTQHMVTFLDRFDGDPTLSLKYVGDDGKGGISTWTVGHEITATRYTLGNQIGKTSHFAEAEEPSAAPLGGLTMFDYELSTASTAEVDKNARIRLEEDMVDAISISGAADDSRLAAGTVFALTDHPSDTGAYLATSTTHYFSFSGFGNTTGDLESRVMFQAIPAKTRYRPKRRTAWPLVSGVQRGQVVAISKEGTSVRLRMGWDVSKTARDKGTMWVPFDGADAGTSPKKGDWVYVSFVEGDPSLPVITGR
jgi:type VI secretion system secreted protein VgrG